MNSLLYHPSHHVYPHLGNDRTPPSQVLQIGYYHNHLHCLSLVLRSSTPSTQIRHLWSQHLRNSHPLNGAIPVNLNRNIESTPGSHAFLWIPSIRFLETHPFTMVLTDPVEFVVRIYDGFTAHLYTLANAHPGRRLRARLTVVTARLKISANLIEFYSLPGALVLVLYFRLGELVLVTWRDRFIFGFKSSCSNFSSNRVNIPISISSIIYKRDQTYQNS